MILEPRPDCDSEGVCITCSDQGLVLRVTELGTDGLALCADETGRQVEVQTNLIDGVNPGDRLVVHAGVAIARLESEVESS